MAFLLYLKANSNRDRKWGEQQKEQKVVYMLISLDNPHSVNMQITEF